MLVQRLFRQAGVFLGQGEGFTAQEFAHGQCALVVGQGELAEKLAVVEADRRRVRDAEAVIHGVDPRPHRRAEAHRAWLAGGVKFATGEHMRVQVPAGIADGDDFAVSGGILGGKYLVPAFADNFASAHDHGAEWAAVSAAHTGAGEFDGPPHERFVCHHADPPQSGALGKDGDSPLASGVGAKKHRGMLEICIDGVASARAAEAGGADRVELCANLPEGGVTPSAGMIRGVRGSFSGGLMVIIRPRGYDFLYSDDELEVMLHDIQVARELGADGVVIGCLTADGRVDRERCARLIEAAGSLDVTFHRAFDMTRDLFEAMADIRELGVRRILTSGGCADVPMGVPVIAELVRRAAGGMSLMPGGGVTPDNLTDIMTATGVQEIHLSARHAVRGGMTFQNPGCGMGAYSAADEYGWREASEALIRQAKQGLNDALNCRLA